MAGSVMDLLNRTEDHRRGALDRPAYQVPGAVPVLYLGEPLLGRHKLAVRAGRHVAEGQHAGKLVRRRLELQPQDAGKSAFAGFDDGAGVMRDQLAQHGVGAPGVAQVPCAVELVQAREGKAGVLVCRPAQACYGAAYSRCFRHAAGQDVGIGSLRLIPDLGHD